MAEKRYFHTDFTVERIATRDITELSLLRAIQVSSYYFFFASNLHGFTLDFSRDSLSAPSPKGQTVPPRSRETVFTRENLSVRQER